MNKKALVVDLDGTLYATNTFHRFIVYIFIHSIKTFNLLLLIKLKIAVAGRLFHFLSHAKMKYYIIKAIQNQNIDYSRFVNNISTFKRSFPEIKSNEFHIKILATAAPSNYASIISENENFNVCLATKFTKTEFNNEFENIKEIKKNNVIKYLKNIDIHEIDTLITDHIDDLPLMKLSRTNIIINPSSKLKSELKQHHISYKII